VLCALLAHGLAVVLWRCWGCLPCVERLFGRVGALGGSHVSRTAAAKGRAQLWDSHVQHMRPPASSSGDSLAGGRADDRAE
jgi:hypothetical protein